MKPSLLLRFGTVITILFLLAVSGMLSSVFIAETAEGYAAAINQAGTLRMQSYRITSSLVHGSAYEKQSSDNRTAELVDEYNQRLFSPRIQDVLARGPSQAVLDTYRKVEEQWKQVIEPNLDNYLRHPPLSDQTAEEAALTAQYERRHLMLVDDFVEDIHRFVEALEVDAEHKNQQLRAIQLILLFLTFLITVISLYLTKRYVLAPLHDLLACAKAARHGDFSVRSRFLSEDELGQLGQAFNVMAEDLSAIYADLEARVAEKTHDLERSNRSLELLYSATKRLSESSLGSEALEAVIHDIEHLLGARSGTVCLGRPSDTQAYRYASTSPRDYLLQDNLERDCSRCLGQGQSHRFELTRPGESQAVQIFSTPIKDKAQQFGVMLIEFPQDKQLEPWQERLLETVASHIALAINVAKQVSEKRRMALLEERSVIARELHDSIAQSLSYLKIQVSRLDKAIHEEHARHDLLLLSAVLRSALNGTYRQLRELLTTFRLRVSEADLGAALKTTVDEFSKRSGIEITYNNRLGHCQPSPNAEIHIIQIVREALSNVIRHADATQASVNLSCGQEGVIELTIEDNGIGIDLQSDMMQHYGLPIMKERAEWLGGDLSVSELEDGGTRIALRFSINDSDSDTSKDNLSEQLNHV
ncbi:MAG: type IV pili methyl-accepting chemotaxis transducer N-terminal domain-containing protein [Candidatus Thiodiazotropha sp.]